jgi:hypothetical protein
MANTMRTLITVARETEGPTPSQQGPNTSNQNHDLEAVAGAEKKTEQHDLFVVDWDGPDDSKSPMNWPSLKKIRQLTGMGFNSFLTWVESLMHNDRTAWLFVG